MNIKHIRAYLRHIGIISCLLSNMALVHAASSPSIKPLPIIYSSVEHLGQRWTGIDRDGNIGLQLLFNQQFSVWSTVGKEYSSVLLPKQYIWTNNNAERSDDKHYRIEGKNKESNQGISLQIYNKLCDLQDLSLSGFRFGLGGRIAFSPKLIVGGYYYFNQATCTQQSNMFPNDFQIETLGYNHSVGIELIQPLIQFNLSGYYKHKAGPYPSNFRRGPKKIIRDAKKDKPAVIAEAIDFETSLQNAPSRYSAHEALMFDQWGMTGKLLYHYQAELKIFGKAHYIHLPSERFIRSHFGINLGLEYRPQAFFVIIPKIKWDTIQGLQVACAAQLEWQDSHINRAQYNNTNYYLTQLPPQEKISFLFKRDAYYKVIERYRTAIKNDAPALQRPASNSKVADALSELIQSYYPKTPQLSLDNTPQLSLNSPPNYRDQLINLIPYVDAMQDSGSKTTEERKLLLSVIKKLSKSSFEPINPLAKKESNVIKFAPKTPDRLGKNSRNKNESDIQQTGKQISDAEGPQQSAGDNSQVSDAEAKEGTKYAALAIGDIYYATRKNELITYTLSALTQDTDGGYIPEFSGIGSKDKEAVYQLRNNQLTRKGKSITRYQVKKDHKTLQIKLYPDLTADGKPTGQRIVINKEGVALLETPKK